MQPDVVPSPEGEGGVAMMAGEFLGEIGFFESQLRFRDAGDAEVFDEYVRGEQNESAHGMRSGVDEGDGTSVAVADEDGIFDIQLREQIG